MTARHGSRPAQGMNTDLSEAFSTLAGAALDRSAVTGWTHNFYRYPARFSPQFASAAIRCFSEPGDLVLDPYMGGGTTVLEALATGRHAVGNDLNSLAVFVTRVKTTGLSPSEIKSVRNWVRRRVPTFTYDRCADDVSDQIDLKKTRNLSLARARFIKKLMAAALASIERLPTNNSRDFARCALLKVGQWALDGRSRHTPLEAFRERLTFVTDEMLEALGTFSTHIGREGGTATLINGDATDLPGASVFQDRTRADLVVTSPPYPGVHVLYHRWQVDGRRETPAPYWIAGCDDGQGASYYNFGDRRESAADKYFDTSLRTLQAVRRVMRDGAHIVQMVAFNRPEAQLPRYLENMREAGFAEVLAGAHPGVAEGRVWREVPNRKWHACFVGKTHSANEVVLVHRAV